VLEITADDFGALPELDAGILVAARLGAVHRVSALAARLRPGHRLPDVPVGVHVDLSDGPFLTSFRPSAGPLGDKRDLWLAAIRGQVDPFHIEAEVEAQIATLAERLGAVPAHVDVHNHLHLAHPQMLEVITTVASRCGIRRIRWPVEPLGEEAIRRLAVLDRRRGFEPAPVHPLHPAFDEAVLGALILRMRESALADALVYPTAAARLTPPHGAPHFCGTVFGHLPSLRRLRAHAWRAERSDGPVELMTHPGLVARGRGFAGRGRTRELLVLLAHRLSRLRRDSS
jgi:predicted glycoside hydrolase/deacetylase ChbG (UPF0249 family)